MGERGARGQSLTAAPLADDDRRCDGSGGLLVSTESGDDLGVLCNGAPGAKGDQGDPGSGGLAGSDCALPDGTSGSVAMTVASDSAISFKCATASGGDDDGGGGGGNVGQMRTVHVNLTDAGAGVVTSDDGSIRCTSSCSFRCSRGLAAGSLHPNGICSSNGHIAIAGCVPGWGDGNNDSSDGCETDLSTNTSCGSVGTAVPASGHKNAVWACVAYQV